MVTDKAGRAEETTCWGQLSVKTQDGKDRLLGAEDAIVNVACMLICCVIKAVVAISASLVSAGVLA